MRLYRYTPFELDAILGTRLYQKLIRLSHADLQAEFDKHPYPGPVNKGAWLQLMRNAQKKED